MMSEYYDRHHRWEPLAEFHFNINDDEDLYEDDNYIYCLCSRVFIRDVVKTYYTEREDASESDVEVAMYSRTQDCQEWDDQSHVHFSVDTSYKVKCEKDEGASCYCSASHTENYCSTDEHDPAQIHGNISHALQPSDSGADLTYPDFQSDITTHDKLEKMDQDRPAQIYLDTNEDYLSEDTWEKFWAINGERIIWASWIKRYSDYINPQYLDDTKGLTDVNNIPKQHSVDEIFSKNEDNPNDKAEEAEESMRERKFSYDSKVNPFKKGQSQESTEKTARLNELRSNKDGAWTPISRRRSCSEHDRMLSPRTLAGTDSMTNVTKITLSSYDVTSSHVTSESTPTDDYSVSSSSSDDQNDQTRIVNIDENQENTSEALDTDQYWQFLWKKHFGELYALHYATYIESHDALNKDLTAANVEVISETKTEEKPEIECKADTECENSDGPSQEIPSVIEVQTQVEEMKIEDKIEAKEEEKDIKPKRKSKKMNNRYLGSVGVLLQTLLKEEQKKKDQSEVVEAGDDSNDKTEAPAQDVVDASRDRATTQHTDHNNHFSSLRYNDGEEDPPEEKPVTLKRSHELDEDEMAERVKSTFEIMGLCMHPDNVPKGVVVYRKRNTKLRPPRSKKFGASKKTYFDDCGNVCYKNQARDSQDEREMQTDEDCSLAKSDNEIDAAMEITKPEFGPENDPELDNNEANDVTVEASKVPFPPDLDTTFSDVLDDDNEQKVEDVGLGTAIKRKRRQKRYKLDDTDIAEMPPELAGDPKMIKYWKKRHSLFHRFDEGIKLDRESWFSVTPENVARHIANKYVYDVVLDAFCGAGGNTIQFAMVSEKVIAIDIDPVKIEMARHNATVYGVADRIDFVVGDFFELAPKMKADMVFLSPPWGGPNYSENYKYDIETMLEPRPASELMRAARDINPNIALYLPRNTRTDQIVDLAKEAECSVEVEQSYLDRRFVAITAYFY